MKQPTTTELAQIAAVIRSGNPKLGLMDCANDALGLWMDCAIVLMSHEQKSEREQELQKQWARQRYLMRNPDERRLQFGYDNDSECVRWLLENATNPRDQLKTFRAFRSAWLEYCPGDQSTGIYVYELKRFLAAREKTRQEADRLRKELGAAKTRSNKLSKTSAGKPGKPGAKKARS